MDVLTSALDRAAFIGGPAVEAFEKEFASFCGVSDCVGVGSGTDAVRFALMAAGVKQGSIVITVPNTFIATTEAITQAGARPDFVDVDDRTYNMDPEKLREYLEQKCSFDEASGELIHRTSGLPVSAVIPVHLYGQPADMDPILELGVRYNLIVVEDACQAHGAEYFSRREQRWRKAGSMGKAAAFSFYPGKNLGACGEAGAVTTNDPDVVQKVRTLRDHGQSRKYHHEIEGYNARLDAIQAGILQVKLRHLSMWNQQRRQCAERYRELLNGTEGLIFPVEPEWSRAVYHLYVVRVEDRDGLQRQLAAVNIGTAIHYPVPLHLQAAYARLGYRAGDFPMAERCCASIVSLPMYPTLQAEEQALVAQAIQVYLSQVLANQLATAAGGGY
jgi:dTDP-4-amino-4,6-dideoxygalactose transaminase